MTGSRLHCSIYSFFLLGPLRKSRKQKLKRKWYIKFEMFRPFRNRVYGDSTVHIRAPLFQFTVPVRWCASAYICVLYASILCAFGFAFEYFICILSWLPTITCLHWIEYPKKFGLAYEIDIPNHSSPFSETATDLSIWSCELSSALNTQTHWAFACYSYPCATVQWKQRCRSHCTLDADENGLIYVLRTRFVRRVYLLFRIFLQNARRS